MALAVLAALASAFCFALGAALQHREAIAVSSSGVADPRLLWKLCQRPLWLAGTLADLASMALHVLALSLGTLALVQPLGVTGLLWAIPLAAVLRRTAVRKSDIAAGAAVGLGLFVLLKALPTRPGHHLPTSWSMLALAGGVFVFVAAMTGIAHFAPGRPRAILLALAAGTSFGLTAVLIRTVMLLVRHGGTAAQFVTASVATSVLGLIGYLLLQTAYRSGHFAGSLATTSVLNPLVAVLAGGLLLHEGLPGGWKHLTVIGVAGAVICGGIAQLVRSPAVLHFETGSPVPPLTGVASGPGVAVDEAPGVVVGAAPRQ
ncbi:hypothetical protein SAMN04515671_4011 [Nakamurella panacisegetis]|uniref:Magnesium transporter NIPA n=1 Tax=Nakamurella panacisegetis TaxID=1090615 RepID=A0A1H0SD33_9ACTN|nr:DMT family transporter [Nakamurella panacisegetis]SDP39086.1 hypothetical protein SAMN04515671_4011 [Nakamurella panacisegetis]